MKKLISIILCVAICLSVSASVLAADIEIVGGKISFTQFLGTSRENTTSVQLYMNTKAYIIDTDTFYDIADSMIITSNIEPNVIENNGIFIGISNKNGIGDFAYLSAEGIDRATPASGRPLYALYTVDNVSFIEKIIALTGQQNNIKYSDWAAVEIAKAKELNIIPDNFSVLDYTQPITREAYCILSAKMIESKLGYELDTANPEYSLDIVDANNINIKKLYAAGIIKGKYKSNLGVIFAPNDLITREEAAALLHRTVYYLEIETPSLVNAVYYQDENEISDWAVESVRILHNMNIMQGADAYSFVPKDIYTTEQAISTMVRVYEYK